MPALDWMKESLAHVYDRLEKLLTKYEKSHAHDDLYRELSEVVYSVDGPNDAMKNGGKGYYCKDRQWHGQWPADAS